MENSPRKFNLRLAVFYSITAALIGWGVGCIVGLTLLLLLSRRFGPIAFGALMRVPLYHAQFFYLYIAVIAFCYGVFLMIFLRWHPKRAIYYYSSCFLGLFLIVSVSAYPCTVLFVLQDMLSGFFPNDPWHAISRWLPDAWLAGWMIVLLAFPLNIGALAGFLLVTRSITRRFDAGVTPKLLQRLLDWNRRYPDRTFFAIGTVLFAIGCFCNTMQIGYDQDSFWQISVRPLGITVLIPFAMPLWGWFMTALFWPFRFIHYKLAYTLLFAGFLFSSLYGIWQAQPLNVFIAAIKPIYNKDMRLEKLVRYDGLNGGNLTLSGEMSCPDRLIDELKRSGKLDANGIRYDNRWSLEIKPIEPSRYAFLRTPPPESPQPTTAPRANGATSGQPGER